MLHPNNSNAGGRAIALLKQYRPYLEMIPSMRRSQDSLITIPLPLIRLRGLVAVTQAIEPLENEADPLNPFSSEMLGADE